MVFEFPTILELTDIGCTEAQAEIVIQIGAPINIIQNLTKEEILDAITEIIGGE